MGRVDQKVCVITGGANGIGRATCEMLAKEGAHVATKDVGDGEPAVEVSYWHLDVAKEPQVDEFFSAVLSPCCSGMA